MPLYNEQENLPALHARLSRSLSGLGLGYELVFVNDGSTDGTAALLARQADLTVITHPQVPGQCASFLRKELTRARVLPASSTAEAVRAVVGAAEHGQAALGTLLAAEIYGGTVIREGVQDRDDNETRFVWLARTNAGAAQPPLREPTGEGWKTSLVFWGPGADSPGWLVRCLDEFARRAINLTKIESRPRREQLGSYMFFADLEGRVEDRRIAEALHGVSAHCQQVRVLGSYPAASTPSRA